MFFLWIHCNLSVGIMLVWWRPIFLMSVCSALACFLSSIMFAETKLNRLKGFLHYFLLAGSPSYFSYVCWLSAWGTACWSAYLCRSFLSKSVCRICWCLCSENLLSSVFFLPICSSDFNQCLPEVFPSVLSQLCLKRITWCLPESTQYLLVCVCLMDLVKDCLTGSHQFCLPMSAMKNLLMSLWTEVFPSVFCQVCLKGLLMSF